MAKRQSKPLTLRERQCRKVARDKALRKIIHAWRRRFLLAGCGMTLVCVGSAGVWEWRSHGISNAAARAMNGVYAATASLGFNVRSTYLEGRSRTDKQDVMNILGPFRGQPILGVSLDGIRERLEKLPSVKSASVERLLPGTLYVRLVERQPVAVWQDKGRLRLIDDEGVAMDDLALSDYPTLPLVIGKGAPGSVEEAQELLSAQPAFARHVTALIRVGDRRWDIRLQGGMEVKLPEKEPVDAWSEFVRIENEQALAARGIRSVDLRQPGRLTLKLLPGARPAGPPARET